MKAAENFKRDKKKFDKEFNQREREFIEELVVTGKYLEDPEE